MSYKNGKFVLNKLNNVRELLYFIERNDLTKKGKVFEFNLGEEYNFPTKNTLIKIMKIENLTKGREVRKLIFYINEFSISILNVFSEAYCTYRTIIWQSYAKFPFEAISMIKM